MCTFERALCPPIEIVLVYGSQSNLLPLLVKKAEGVGERKTSLSKVFAGEERHWSVSILKRRCQQ